MRMRMKCRTVIMCSFNVEFMLLLLTFVSSRAAPSDFRQRSVLASGLGRTTATILNYSLPDTFTASTDPSLSRAPNASTTLLCKNSTIQPASSELPPSEPARGRTATSDLLSKELSDAGHPPCSTCPPGGVCGPPCDSAGVCEGSVSGDECDSCQPGFYLLSGEGCLPCRCNQHSNSCLPHSGICLDCQDNTEGSSCEQCRSRFYRRPGAMLTEVCVPCPCSSVTSTGSCHIDSSRRPVCDQCKLGYQGPNCDQCRDGFYNSDSICLPCNCSGHSLPQGAPPRCQPEAGYCLSCGDDTAGRHCEHCAEGYVGNVLTNSCTPAASPFIANRPSGPPAQAPSPRPPPALLGDPVVPGPSRPVSKASLSGPVAPSAPVQLTNTTTVLQGDTRLSFVVSAVCVVTVVMAAVLVGVLFSYRKFCRRRLSAALWRVRLNGDLVHISSFHDSDPGNDACALLEDSEVRTQQLEGSKVTTQQLEGSKVTTQRLEDSEVRI